MTPDEIRRCLGLGPEWEVVWRGREDLHAQDHLCVGPFGPGETQASQWVSLPYLPTATSDVYAATCARCRVAWVRSKPSRGRMPS